jgi:hypothetical protein
MIVKVGKLLLLRVVIDLLLQSLLCTKGSAYQRSDVTTVSKQLNREGCSSLMGSDDANPATAYFCTPINNKNQVIFVEKEKRINNNEDALVDTICIVTDIDWF